MSISLAVGTENIEADNLKDLKSSVDTLMGIAHPLFANGLDKPVSQFPSNIGPVAVNYTSGNGSWTAGDFTFGLCGGVGGAVGILGQGQNLQTYTKTFPTTIGDDLGGRDERGVCRNDTGGSGGVLCAALAGYDDHGECGGYGDAGVGGYHRERGECGQLYGEFLQEGGWGDAAAGCAAGGVRGFCFADA